MSRRTKSDELDAALRADPDYQDLRAMLHKQTEKQKRRFSQTFAEERNMESTEDITTRIVELKGQGLTYPQIAERLNAEGLRTAKGGLFTRTNVQQYVLRFNKRQATNTGEAAKAGEPIATEEPDVEPANVGESFGQEEPDVSLAIPCETVAQDSVEPEIANGGERCEAIDRESSVAKHGEVCEDSTLANIRQPCEALDLAKRGEPIATLPDQWLAIIRRVVREELSSMQVTQTVAQTTANDFPTVPRNPGARGLAGKRETLPGCRVDEVLYNRFNADRAEQRISASDLMNRILWHYYGKPKLSFEE